MKKGILNVVSHSMILLSNFDSMPKTILHN